MGQSYELTVPLPDALFGPDQLAPVRAAFHAAHERAYGFSAPDEPVELVTLRLTAVGAIAKPRTATSAVYFAERGDYVDCPIYDRYRLGAGAVLAGPAIVEEFDSTSVIHPGYQARVDRYGNLLLTRAGRDP